MDKQKKTYVRKSLNINEWLDSTGGLLLVFDIFFVGIVVFFTAREYRSNFVRQNWRVVHAPQAGVGETEDRDEVVTQGDKIKMTAC